MGSRLSHRSSLLKSAHLLAAAQVPASLASAAALEIAALRMATAALRPRTVEPDARLALGSVRCPPNPQSRVSKDGTCGGYTGYTCKGSVFGNGCSRNGYCGKTSEYCGAGCNSKFGTCGVVGRPRSLAAAPRSDLLLRGRLLPRRSALLLRRVLRLPSHPSSSSTKCTASSIHSLPSSIGSSSSSVRCLSSSASSSLSSTSPASISASSSVASSVVSSSSSSSCSVSSSALSSTVSSCSPITDVTIETVTSTTITTEHADVDMVGSMRS
ncbi:uncharacterized protein CC84DRAFT_1177859 [Paraphaeosphaeria sporulosa]|uniref:Chitin-binding type-1 domain-containing protein n=1 Tax=Paraphaeosphaeria sporulosa TaxID=1460663 RepID=A0A177C862_9PLEO|nr:uncharacterized protein CC84DRAFT_1177859 [Paraphaeosphaeria sporulosa]OAG03934.1 hypothetical protein CC84DRAFT_1177859 [Paraphaeosphaeria sporulosa]